VCILSTYPLEKGEYGTISGTSMASPHVAGALALLASINNPATATNVYNLYNQVKSAGNYNWTDDSGDGIKEPLLDVSNSNIFDPVLVPGNGGGGGNTPPTVNISSPADGASFDSGATISFVGSAADDEDGSLTSGLVWTSSLDGQIGTGGSFSAVLSGGIHTITAAVIDSSGESGSDSITITVRSPVSQTVTVVSMMDQSYLINKNFWKATALITIDPALSGAVVSGEWSGGATATCTTDGSGQCTVSLNVRTKANSITFTVNNVSLTGYEYISSLTNIVLSKP
jgi:hypothetical protein